MTETHFEILRAGTNSSIQDHGRKNLYHIGITISGAMDQKIFKLSNALVNNNLNEGVIEFAYQGPLLKLKNGSANFAITGNVDFNILRKNSIVEKGKCFQSYLLEKDDQLDIVYTKDSVFGYLAIEGGFKIEKVWNSFSVNTKAKIGPNNGEKFSTDEKIYLKKSEANNFEKKNIEYNNSVATTIRTVKGTNFDYFSNEAKNKFFKEEYQVTNLSDRMGMRLEGPKLDNTVNTNIKSEGLVKGVVQVPADGNPIIMFSDHGSIGGYPKIAVVITADHDRAAQLVPGSKIKFKEVDLDEAESLFKNYSKGIKDYLEKIK
ncbi:biotin-dependent carboxyltransferase family protein [Candidatus Pelagibacter sp.]|nr:biotin-dependent carboxyltransferase family protein [Candidatus Pelagibacter sp.]